VNDELLKNGTAALERIAAVLAALYADSMGDINQGNKAERLSRLGFSNAQIADALGTSANAVNVGRVTHRRKTKGGKTARRSRKSGNKKAK
jgi:DNA-binding CsgD family transcriptional regulator